MFNVTLKVQLSPGARLPPLKVNRVSPALPVSAEPAPQGGVGATGSVAVNSVMPIAAKSSVKLMSVASAGAFSEWVSVY